VGFSVLATSTGEAGDQAIDLQTGSIFMDENSIEGSGIVGWCENLYTSEAFKVRSSLLKLICSFT